MVNQQYIYICDICYTEIIDNVGIINFGDTPHYPSLPEGWKYFKNLIICDKHEIETKIDGELI